MSVTADMPSELGHTVEPHSRNRAGSHRFTWELGAIVVIGIVARVLFVARWTWGEPLHGDPLYFQQSATYLANGKGYVAHFLGKGQLRPTAVHPPAFSFLLAGLDFVHLRLVDAHRIALAFISSLGVLSMGLVGRRLAGAGVGLLAAGIAALDPLWTQWGGSIMSESLYLVIVPTMLLFALRCIDRPNPVDFFALGLLIGLATLTRSEAVDFVVLLGFVALVVASGALRERMVYALVFVAGVALCLVPWVVRNDVQMGSLTLSTNGGLTLSGSYSPGTYSPSNPDYGSFDTINQFGLAAVIIDYERPPDHARLWTEATLSNALGNSAKSYARAHLADLPGEVLAREGRAWGVYAPGSELAFDTAEELTGARGPKQAGQILNWVLLPLAVLGAVLLGRRSRRRLLVVLIPVAVVAINAALFFGSTRMRVAAEPSIDLLAAVGALWFAGRIAGRDLITQPAVRERKV